MIEQRSLDLHYQDNMKLTLIITTMNLTNDKVVELIRNRPLQSFVIVSNQCRKEEVVKGSDYLIINSKDRGVSLARNKMIDYIPLNTDYVMFLDDDVTVDFNIAEMINEEIKSYKNVNAIYYNCVSLNKERPIRSIKKSGKIKWRSVSSYGVWGLVIKVSAIKEYNLSFREEFGPGSMFPVGEDSIYLKELINKVPNVYMSKKKLIHINQKESTWFKGYNEQYFINVGAAKSVLYPKKFLLETFKTYLFAIKHSKYSFRDIRKFMNSGKKQLGNFYAVSNR